MMKSEKIPEHKLNFTATVDQVVENMTSNEYSKSTASEKIQAKQGNVGKRTSDMV